MLDHEDRALVKPKPIDVPWSPVPSTVTVTVADADQARALWDRDVPEYSGLLAAEILEG